MSDYQFDVIMSVENGNGTQIELHSNIGQWSVSKYSTKTGLTEPLTAGLCNEHIYNEVVLDDNQHGFLSDEEAPQKFLSFDYYEK